MRESLTNQTAYDVAVIGGGPAGLAAALAAQEQGARVVLFDRETALGGILRQCVHNGFGLHYFGEELTGPEYARRLARVVLGSPVEAMTGAMVLDIAETKDGCKRIRASVRDRGVCEVQARAVVLATGCRERTRGALRIAGTRPAGVYTAGSAQLMTNLQGVLPGRRVVILGSGDIGLIMARRLTWEGAKVVCVAEVLPYPGGLARNVAQCLTDFGIPLHLRHTVSAIHGKSRVTGVTLTQVDGQIRPIPGTAFEVACDTLLLSVGLIPENELARGLGIRMDAITGGPEVDEWGGTDTPGVYTCGNALLVNDLADDASAQGQRAGQAAAAYAVQAAMHVSQQPNAFRAVRAGQDVRFCVPQRISPDCDEVTVHLRVARPLGGCVIQAMADGQVLAKVTRMAASPGEMQQLLMKNLLQVKGEITLTAKEMI